MHDPYAVLLWSPSKKATLSPADFFSDSQRRQLSAPATFFSDSQRFATACILISTQIRRTVSPHLNPSSKPFPSNSSLTTITVIWQPPTPTPCYPRSSHTNLVNWALLGAQNASGPTTITLFLLHAAPLAQPVVAMQPALADRGLASTGYTLSHQLPAPAYSYSVVIPDKALILPIAHNWHL